MVGEAAASTGAMSDIISQLTTGVTATTIFGVVKDVMPFVIVLIIVFIPMQEFSFETIAII